VIKSEDEMNGARLAMHVKF